MTELSYPAPEDGRSVTEAQYELITKKQGVGLYGVPTDPTCIFGDSTGMQVKVRANQNGRIFGYGWENDGSVVTKAIGANASGSTRIDLVVLRLDRTAAPPDQWKVRVAVVAGVPGNPAPSPTIDADVYEMPLAEVTVIDGASTITAAQVKNRAWYFGSISGEYVCLNTDSRPPVAEGLKLHESSTGKGFVGVGGSWSLVYENSGLTVCVARAGWTFAVNKIQRRNGLVQLALSVRRTGAALGSSGANVPVCDIPDGFRPAWSFEFPTFHVAASPSMGTIGTDGVVSVRPYGGIGTGVFVVLSPMTYLLA